MKFMTRIFSRTVAAFFAGIAFFSCAGNSGDEEGTVILLADKTSILGDGTDAVEFSVRFGSADVTSEAEIICENDGSVLDEPVFVSTSAGAYSFKAVYQEQESMPVSVTVIAQGGEEGPVEPAEPSKFVKQVCIFEFTGQWCQQCPSGMQYLDFIIQRNFSEIAHVIAIHNASGGDDAYVLPEESNLGISDHFALTGYPAAVIDMEDVVYLNSDGGTLRPLLTEATERHPRCGMSISSEYDESASSAEVTVKLMPEVSQSYRLAVYVVEDNIKDKQAGATVELYNHRHVARQVVTDSFFGDNIGTLTEDQESERTYTVTVDGGWNLDETSVYAILVDESGHALNMTFCPIKNGDAPYVYVEE